MDRYIIQSLPKTKRVRLQKDENVEDPITGTDISPTSSENVPQNCSKFLYLFDKFYKLLSTNGDKIMASCVTCHKKICASTKSSVNLLSHIKVSFLNKFFFNPNISVNFLLVPTQQQYFITICMESRNIYILKTDCIIFCIYDLPVGWFPLIIITITYLQLLINVPITCL